MRRTVIAALLALGLASTAYAATETRDAGTIPAYEPVESIWVYGGFHDFDVVDERTLILWANAFQPYLVELTAPSHDLRYAHAIGVDSRMSRLYSRFDSVWIAGFRYSIGQIYKLTRDEARELTRES